RMESAEEPRFVIFDFRQVTGIDSSAVVLFERIALLAREHGLVLMLTGLISTHRAQFSQLIAEYDDVIRDEVDLDHGMAWCEDRLLDDAGEGNGEQRTLPGRLAHELGPYLAARTIPAGSQLMRQGEPTSGIFIIMSGRVTVLLEGRDGEQVRLRTLLEGTVLGEISLYRDEPHTATAVADTDCDVLHLTPERFEDLCREAPAVAADFHAFVARILAGRVSHANRAIRALQS
ncbi:MAG: cyclic nucleotide-binding domain-containing protein, partial [Acidimicrobiia bacterium]